MAQLKAGEIPDPKKYLELMFKGSGGSGGATDFANHCKDMEGKVRGIGPNCRETEEEGKKEYAICWYDRATSCIQDLSSRIRVCCEEYVAIVLSRERSLNPECYKAAEDSFDECSKDIKNKCECKSCVINLAIGDKEDDETVDEDPKDKEVDHDIDKVDPIRERILQTNSNYGIIPRVFGRYIVPGNIIWLGNRVESEVTYVKTLNNGESSEVTDNLTQMDFLVGIAVGELNSVLRIWSGAALVFNQTLTTDGDGNVVLTSGNNGATDIDLSALVDSDYSMERLTTFRPTVEFYTGAQSQKVIDTISTAEGFGRVPAHRGLALVFFRGIDLRLFDGTFPDLRFDVISNTPDTETPSVESTPIADLEDQYLEVDQRLQLVYVRTNDEYKLLDLDSLTEVYSADAGAATAQLALKSGYLYENDGTNTQVYDPFFERTRKNFGPQNQMADGSTSMIVFDENYAMQEVILSQASDGALDAYVFDHSNFTGSLYDSSVAGSAGAIFYRSVLNRVTIDDDGDISYERQLFQFMLPDPTQNALRIRRLRVSDGSSEIVDPVTVVSTTSLANTILWGSDTSGVSIAGVFVDTTDGFFVVAINTASSAFLVKLNSSLSVVWTQEVPKFSPFSTVGDIRGTIATPLWRYISDDGDVIKVLLSDGSWETEVEGLGIGGAQYYDAKTGSIVYMDDSSPKKIVRAFFGKIIAEKVSLGEIIRGLLNQAGNITHGLEIDTTDIEDILIDGFAITTKTTLRDVFQQLSQLYQIGVVDDGNKISFVKELSLNSLAPTVVLDPDTDVIVDSAKRVRDFPAERVNSASAKFVNIDNAGLIEVVQRVSFAPEDAYQFVVPTGVDVASSVDFNVNVNDTAEHVRQHLEVALLYKIFETNRLEVALMPRMLAIVPRDRVSYLGEVFRIHTSVVGAPNGSAIAGDFFDETAVETFASLAAVPMDNGVILRKPVARKPYRPVALFLPPILGEDAARTLDGNQIVYTGLEVPNLDDVTPTRFNMRLYQPAPIDRLEEEGFSGGDGGVITFEPTSVLPDTQSRTYQSRTHSTGMHSGELITPPVGPRQYPFVTDRDSSMVVLFDHEATADLFYTLIDDEDAISYHPLSNLLVVGEELIQFSNFSVDMDGKTCTFTNLVRGNYGTDPYMTHVAGERCYLYTAESFYTMAVDPQFTHKRQTAKIMFTATMFAGVQSITYNKEADGGSARPWSTAYMRRFDISGGAVTDIALDFLYRRSFITPALSVDDVPNDYGTIFRGAILKVPITTETFNERFLKDYYEPGLLDDLVHMFFEVDTAEDGNVVTLDVAATDLDPLVDTLRVLIYQINTLGGVEIKGQPVVWQFPPGVYPELTP